MTAELTRRGFFGGAAALMATAAARSYAASVGAGKPNLTFGVLSDIHISPAAYMAKYLLGDKKAFRPRETDLFERALAYFDERGADAVVLAGDLADWGLVGQMKAVADCWWQRFPNGRSRRDGRPVELLAVTGNHDVAFRAWTVGKNYATPAMGAAKIPDEDMFRKDVPRHWQELFHEPYAPIWQKTVKGYTFIGANWDSDRGIDAVEPYLAEHGPALKGTKPFFFIQHPHPKDTCFGPKVSGHDSGQATRALSPYPNAVALSGHAHRPLTDEQNVWQGDFTSIGTGTLDSLTLERGRENGPRKGSENRRQAMPALRGRVVNQDLTFAAHGLFISVYDGFLEVERREFVEGRPLGDNWIIPVPAGEKAPFRFDVRAAQESAPGPFPDGAQVTVAETADEVRLEFPPARNVDGAARAMEYEVEATVEEADVRRLVFRRYVHSPGVFKVATLERGPIVAVFRKSLFPREGLVSFAVRARSTFGHFNAPICGQLSRLLMRRTPWARWIAYSPTVAAPVRDVPTPSIDAYGGWQVPVAPAAGFFRTARADGRWWLADPLGNRYLSQGVAVFAPGGSPRQRKALQEKFGSNRRWAESELKTLKAQGFNSLGAWSRPGQGLEFKDLAERLPYTVILSPLSNYHKGLVKKERTPEADIGYHGHPFDFPRVFEPAFDEALDKTLEAAAKYAGDPYLIGYFIDNEIGWEKDALRLCLKRRPAGHPNRAVAEAWLERRKGRAGCTLGDVTDADCRAFVAYCLETYLSKVVRALRRHDPNHLFLGCRFNRWEHELGMEEMFRTAGKYMDVVSVNHYGRWEPDEETFRRWEGWAGKPILVTEFYAKGEDSGLPNQTGGGWVVRTQAERGVFYANFIDKLINSRVCVGWHWFRYMDNDPTDLTTDPSNRDSNKGVVSWDLSHYDPLLDKIREANAQVYAKL